MTSIHIFLPPKESKISEDELSAFAKQVRDVMYNHMSVLDEESKEVFTPLEGNFYYHDRSQSCVKFYESRSVALVFTTSVGTEDRSFWVGVISAESLTERAAFMEHIDSQLSHMKRSRFRKDSFSVVLNSVEEVISEVSDPIEIAERAGISIPVGIQALLFETSGNTLILSETTDPAERLLDHSIKMSLTSNYMYARSAKYLDAMCKTVMSKLLPAINQKSIEIAQSDAELLRDIDGVRLTIAIDSMLQYFGSLNHCCERNTLLLSDVCLLSPDNFFGVVDEVIRTTGVVPYKIQLKTEGEGSNRYLVVRTDRN